MKDISLLKFGRLTALGIGYRKKYIGCSVIYWKCKCECGIIKYIDGRSLRNGTTKSCGCLNKEINSKRLKGISFNKDHKDRISKALLGKKKSISHIENMRKSLIGKRIGEKNPNFGKGLFGIDNPNWRGGKSFEPYPLGWTKTYKEQIRYRDGYKCQYCGVPEIETGRKLYIHHINYDKNNIKSENLISLCLSCHSKTNFNRDNWIQIFTKKVEVQNH